MIDIQRRVTALKYFVGVYPSVWQLPNAVKIYEYQEIAKGFSPKTGNKVLDLGCGRGLQTQLIARGGAEVIGIEPNPKRYALAIKELRSSRVKNRVEFYNGTLDEIELEDETLDHAVSFCVLEHIPNLDDVLKKIFRLLKKGGELHATVDSLGNIADERLIEKHRTEHAVVQYFTEATIEQTLAGAGFTVTEKRPILTSSLARKKLVDELETGNYLDSVERRKQLVKELTDEEMRSGRPERGTMILVRARK